MQLREIRPQPGPQETFLSTTADIAIYGGSAGGGKSWALLLEALRHVGNPRFGAVIFRRTSPMITNEGGLWDESMALYPLAGATPMVGSLDWRFPGGANVGFRHLQHEANKLDWQGAQVPLLGFDELTHFTESQFFYMMSRNRSTCGVRPYIRAGTNPDAASWVRRFLAPWLDRAHPLRAESGEVRWFVRIDGELIWEMTEADLKARFPALFPKSVTFVRASIYDNKILLAKDPGYLANLQALQPVDRARLLDGDWDVKREGLVYPGFDGTVYDPDSLPMPLQGTPVGGIDFGFNNPFCALAATLDHDDVLWIHWERYAARTAISDHSRHLPRGGIAWHADPAGADQIAELRVADHHVVPCVHLGTRPILTGIDRVTHRIATGRLKVSEACVELIREAGLYRYDETKLREEPIDADNHAMSALRYLVTGIDRGRTVDYTRPDTAEEDRARAGREQAERSEAHRDPEAAHWWGEDDD